MARPSYTPVDRTTDGWQDEVNDNFDKVIDAPLVLSEESVAGFRASQYENCLIMQSGTMYISDGTVWKPYRQLEYIADLDRDTATLTDVRNAYNSLLADAKAKDMMASS